MDPREAPDVEAEYPPRYETSHLNVRRRQQLKHTACHIQGKLIKAACRHSAVSHRLPSRSAIPWPLLPLVALDSLQMLILIANKFEESREPHDMLDNCVHDWDMAPPQGSKITNKRVATPLEDHKEGLKTWDARCMSACETTMWAAESGIIGAVETTSRPIANSIKYLLGRPRQHLQRISPL